MTKVADESAGTSVRALCRGLPYKSRFAFTAAQYQPFSLSSESTSNPFAESAARTSSARSLIIPDTMRTAPSFMNAPTSGASLIITSATMFAHTTSYFFSGTAERRSLTAHSTHGVEFRTVFSFATLIDCGSISHAKASAAPSFAAVIARIPLPQPRSATKSPFLMFFSSNSRHMRVVW